MYVRMKDGRDRGEIKEFPFPEAQALLRTGKADTVDLSRPDPFSSKREVRTAATAEKKAVETKPAPTGPASTAPVATEPAATPKKKR